MELAQRYQAATPDGRHAGYVDEFVVKSTTRNFDQDIVRSSMLLEHDLLTSVEFVHENVPAETIVRSVAAED